MARTSYMLHTGSLKAAGRAAANSERRKRPRPPAIRRCPLQPRIIDMLEPYFETGDVLFDLFDEGQVLRQLRQASLVRCDLRLIDRPGQAAISIASSLSFMARRRCTRA